MAKQKGALKLSGTIGDITFTKGKNGALAKKKSKFTEKQRKAAAALPQTSRTAVLNGVAKGLFRVLKECHGKAEPNFWSNILKSFRREKENDRVLLLQQLHGIEEHQDSPFADLCPIPPTRVTESEKFHIVQADLSRPAIPNGEVHCYKIQFILVVWHKNDEVRHMTEESPWLNFNDVTPKFTTIKFVRTAADTEWLLACRIIEGFRFSKGVQAQISRMRVTDTGTVCETAKQILAERRAAQAAAQSIEPLIPGMEEGKIFEIRSAW